MRGSRKHVLDWSGEATFVRDLIALARPVRCEVSSSSLWMPRGHEHPEEARLHTFGPRAIPDATAWPTLRRWWLQNERGANTPNWDIALSCQIEEAPGLLLGEAKANEPELSKSGKWVAAKRSQKSVENHAHIASAIDEARFALARQYPGIAIAINSHYQLSNRICLEVSLFGNSHSPAVYRLSRR